jgi:hypothetical protein
MKTTYNLFRDKYLIGTLEVKSPLESSSIMQGVLRYRNEISENIGWEAKRYKNAFKAFEAFIIKRDIEQVPEDKLLSSPEYSKLEEGEIGHYLFEGNYFITNKKDEHYSIELVGYNNHLMYFELSQKLDICPLLEEFSISNPYQNLFDFQLVNDPNGVHKFGGNIDFEITNLKQHVHLTFTLDLTDVNLPIIWDKQITKIPLLYSFNSMDDFQYQIISNDSINIIHMGGDDDEMIINNQFPESSFSAKELSYKEKRMRVYNSHDSCNSLNAEDNVLWENMGGNTPLLFGGKPPHNQGEIKCCNNQCDHKQPVELFFTLVPFEIDQQRDFWEEYDNEFIDICFYICQSCKNIIVRNSCD